MGVSGVYLLVLFFSFCIEWVASRISDDATRIIARVSNRLLVGLPLCELRCGSWCGLPRVLKYLILERSES